MHTMNQKTVKGYILGELEEKPVAEFKQFCREAAAEGAVLLKNDNNLLPFDGGETVSVFGRIQNNYYKSGTGSGGMVNVEYVTNIPDSLRRGGKVKIYEKLAEHYGRWIEQNPFDMGKGWAQEPWCQQEMPLDDAVVSDAAANSDAAIIIIGRTAGEDKDNSEAQGSYLLTELEEQMLQKVCAAFDKVCVVLNVGNIIDYSFIDKYNVGAVLCVWHGGMTGGDAAADLLCGDKTPSGKLADTAAYRISDYPAYGNFGTVDEIIYREDIYVGYRYFETVARDKVRFPFGFGLSYTEFEVKTESVRVLDGVIEISVGVKNIGKYSGKEVVQAYYGAAEGKLGNPAMQLAAFKKTPLLKPHESCTVNLSFRVDDMASYDDSGATGNKSCYVLEAGNYPIYIGTNVRNVENVYTYDISETVVVKRLCEVLAPVKDFTRMYPVSKDGKTVMEYESVPKRTVDLQKRIADNRPADIEYTGDCGIKLVDVARGDSTIEQFTAQFTDFELGTMIRGEGMNSPKVTPGTGGCFGGTTERLLDFGIPAVCVTDGPSGIRLDSGAKATAMPIGTCLACTWNDELIEELHIYEGLELYAYKVDALLGPGMNIHRYPLNGRNFEYFSEDPLLSGKMGAAVCRGIHSCGPTATIKHFFGNNQEISRSFGDVVMSERAAREIYLRGFEIAVKEGGATAVMTTYNPVNGFWNAGNYDLNTTVLRGEWGYDGIVMTDWWAKSNCEGQEGVIGNDKQMVRAQNDVYMVCKDTLTQPSNLLEGLREGYITKGELQRNFINLLKYIMKSPAFERFVAGGCVRPNYGKIDDSGMQTLTAFDNIKSGETIRFNIDAAGDYVFVFTFSSPASELSQMSITMKYGGDKEIYLATNGTNGEKAEQKREITLDKDEYEICFEFSEQVFFDRLEIKG